MNEWGGWGSGDESKIVYVVNLNVLHISYPLSWLSFIIWPRRRRADNSGWISEFGTMTELRESFRKCEYTTVSKCHGMLAVEIRED